MSSASTTRRTRHPSCTSPATPRSADGPTKRAGPSAPTSGGAGGRRADVSFTWFSQNGALSAVVALSELEATCLMIAAGTGLLGPQAQKYADLGRLLADIMNGGTLYVILDG